MGGGIMANKARRVKRYRGKIAGAPAMTGCGDISVSSGVPASGIASGARRSRRPVMCQINHLCARRLSDRRNRDKRVTTLGESASGNRLAGVRIGENHLIE